MTEFVFWFALVPVYLFVVVYAVVAPWWRTDAGRQSMALGLMLAVLFTLGVLNRTIGMDHPLYHIMRGVAFFTVAVVVWWRLVLLVRVQIVARLHRSRIR